MAAVRKDKLDSPASGGRRVVSRQILGDAVFEALKKMVMDHDRAPGEHLNIDDLARTLEVSPTPVREALARLEAEGLVAKRPLSGYSVAPLLDPARLDQLFEARRLLELPTARLAAERASKAQVAELVRLVAAMRRDGSGHRYEEYREFANDDGRFHAMLAEAARNEVIADVLARLHFHWHLFRIHFGGAVAADTISEHEAIVEALAHHDGDAAALAMGDHLQRSHDRVIGSDPTT